MSDPVETHARTPDRDVRRLRLAVALLAARRHDWGTAMQAELAALTDPAQRRDFSHGCLRAIALSPLTLAGVLSRVIVGGIGVSAVAFTTRAAPAVIVESSVWLVVLGVLAAAGRRRTGLGPVGATTAAGGGRMTAYLLLGGLTLWLLRPRAGGPTHDPSGFWIAALMITLAFGSSLRLTAREPSGSGGQARRLRRAGLAATVATLSWLVLLAFAPVVRTAPMACVVVIGATAALAAVRSARSDLDRPERGVVALITVFSASALCFVVTGLTFRLAPTLAPFSIPPGGSSLGAPTSVLIEQSRLEALDPFLLLLLLSAATGPLSVLAGAVHAQRRPHPQRPHPTTTAAAGQPELIEPSARSN